MQVHDPSQGWLFEGKHQAWQAMERLLVPWAEEHPVLGQVVLGQEGQVVLGQERQSEVWQTELGRVWQLVYWAEQPLVVQQTVQGQMLLELQPGVLRAFLE